MSEIFQTFILVDESQHKDRKTDAKKKESAEKECGAERKKRADPRPAPNGIASAEDQMAPAIRKMAATVRMAYNSGNAARISVLPITSWPLPMAAMPLAQILAW